MEQQQEQQQQQQHQQQPPRPEDQVPEYVEKAIHEIVHKEVHVQCREEMGILAACLEGRSSVGGALFCSNKLFAMERCVGAVAIETSERLRQEWVHKQVAL